MTDYAVDLAAARKIPEDEDVISYILAGLDAGFNPFIESICGRTDPISLSTVYAQVLAAEARIVAQKATRSSYMTTNATSRGRGNGGHFGGSSNSRGGSQSDGCSNGRGHGGRHSRSHPPC